MELKQPIYRRLMTWLKRNHDFDIINTFDLSLISFRARLFLKIQSSCNVVVGIAKIVYNFFFYVVRSYVCRFAHSVFPLALSLLFYTIHECFFLT